MGFWSVSSLPRRQLLILTSPTYYWLLKIEFIFSKYLFYLFIWNKYMLYSYCQRATISKGKLYIAQCLPITVNTFTFTSSLQGLNSLLMQIYKCPLVTFIDSLFSLFRYLSYQNMWVV